METVYGILFSFFLYNCVMFNKYLVVLDFGKLEVFVFKPLAAGSKLENVQAPFCRLAGNEYNVLAVHEWTLHVHIYHFPNDLSLYLTPSFLLRICKLRENPSEKLDFPIFPLARCI